MTFRAETRGGSYVVAVEGLSALTALEEIPGAVKRRALQAINKTADRARAEASRRMRQQIRFTASYLNQSDGSGKPRFGVSQRARGDSLEAVITGRDRPTSLARFVTAGRPAIKGVAPATPVTLQVKPGLAKRSRRMFLINLNSGNRGLAIRLRPGERVDNKKIMVPLKKGSNVYLLYGPSVDQLFRSVSTDIAPDAAEFLEAEFLRLMELDRG